MAGLLLNKILFDALRCLLFTETKPAPFLKTLNRCYIYIYIYIYMDV
jgi:hypothetical protein